jgi:hypothetical protein
LLRKNITLTGRTQDFQEFATCHLTILASKWSEYPKNRAMLSRYNKENQKTPFSQAKSGGICPQAKSVEAKG